MPILIISINTHQSSMDKPPYRSTYQFPDPETASVEGLVSVGGNLSIDCLISAYRNGIFPWFGENDPILWWSLNPRMVIYPKQFNPSRRTKKLLTKTKFNFSFDQDFEQVIVNCAAPRTIVSDGNSTWITNQMVDAYIALHRAGFAHSVECWHQGKLCGGLYGVSLGKIFFGESMFSLISNSSKLALIKLIMLLKEKNFELIDCQMASQLMRQLGGVEIPRKEFTSIVRKYSSLSETSSWPNTLQ